MPDSTSYDPGVLSCQPYNITMSDPITTPERGEVGDQPQQSPNIRSPEDEAVEAAPLPGQQYAPRRSHHSKRVTTRHNLRRRSRSPRREQRIDHSQDYRQRHDRSNRQKDSWLRIQWTFQASYPPTTSTTSSL